MISISAESASDSPLAGLPTITAPPRRALILPSMLILSATLCVMEYGAKRQAASAFDAIVRARADAAELGEALSPDHVMAIARVEPVGPPIYDSFRVRYRYRWRGVLRSYGLTATFGRTGRPGLIGLYPA